MRKRAIYSVCAACCLLAALSMPASALEYTIDAPEAGPFGTPTSDDTVYLTRDEPMNTDRSKTAAVIPPTFGSPTSYTLNSGTLLTPNLVDQDQAAQVTVTGNGTGAAVQPPAWRVSGSLSFSVLQHTEVTEDLYYSGGYLGRLEIPALDLNVKVYEGTGNTALQKGAGHFSDTSIWEGAVALAGHNRGEHDHFNGIWTLDVGDEIIYSTKLGTRTYEVVSVTRVDELDRSGLTASTENKLVLYTCVADEPELRWCVTAKER